MTALTKDEHKSDHFIAAMNARGEAAASALARQEGGQHYAGHIQPIEYIYANSLDYIQGNVVKYITRYKKKGTPLQDLKKIIHYVELLIELEKLDAREHTREQALQDSPCANSQGDPRYTSPVLRDQPSDGSL